MVALLRRAVLRAVGDPDVPRQAVAAQHDRRHQPVPGAVHLPDHGLRDQQLCAPDRAGACLSGECGMSQIIFSPTDTSLFDPPMQIMMGACYLTLFGNIIVYMTIIGYFIFFDNDEDNVYGGMA